MPDTSSPAKTPEPVRAPDAPGLVLAPVDIRRKRPPALSFLLRMDTLRRLARVASLLGLDFLGLFLAIFTALCLKAWALGALDRSTIDGALSQTEDLVSFAFLVCGLLFGTVNSLAEWVRADGRYDADALADAVCLLVFEGLGQASGRRGREAQDLG